MAFFSFTLRTEKIAESMDNRLDGTKMERRAEEETH